MTARSDWPLIFVLFLAGLFAAWQFAKVALVLPDLAAAYDREVVSAAWLVSIVGIVGMIVGAVAGNLVAAYGARRMLILALWLGAAMSVVQAAGLPIVLLGLSRAAEGLSHLLIVVAAPTLIAGAASDAGRSMAMGLWATFFGVAFALGAVVFPPLVAAIGLPGLFLAHAAGLAVFAVVLSRMVDDQPRAPLSFDILEIHARIYTAPRRAMPALCFVFYTVLFVALVTLVPVALNRPSMAAILPLLSLTGTFGAGWLGRRFTPQQVIAAGFCAVLICTGLVWGGSAWAIYPLFATMGLIPGAAFGLIPVLNQAVSDRAMATGGVAQMGNVGTTFGTPIFALLLATGGTDAVWGGVAIFAIVGLATTAGLSHLVRREQAKGVPV